VKKREDEKDQLKFQELYFRTDLRIPKVEERKERWRVSEDEPGGGVKVLVKNVGGWACREKRKTE